MSGTVVIGLGNPLMGDDGFGLAALRRLEENWYLEDVELVDGATWGMSLLPLIEDADRVILLDAVDAGVEPGAVVALERDRLPVYLTRKLSPHQVDLQDVFAAAALRGRLPEDTVVIGVQPESVVLSLDLTPAVANATRAAASIAVARLRRWGHRCVERH